MKPFADQMRDFDIRRRRARITDEELADASGISSATISRYRHGKQQPSVDRWVELSTALERLVAMRHSEVTLAR